MPPLGCLQFPHLFGDEGGLPVIKRQLHRITKKDEIGYFAPRTWEFWLVLLVCFCVFSIAGHWLEIPYCWFMDRFFGIVSDDYAIWSDPWYHPYWAYGFGAVAMTLVIEPLKERIITRRKTLWGALLETFVIAIILSMVMELVIGWLVNQPDANGKYPYWDNSQLPLNIFGQAWLVNDIIIAVVAMLYVWVLYPLIYEGFLRLRPRVAQSLFVVIVIGFAACCTVSYAQLGL